MLKAQRQAVDRIVVVAGRMVPVRREASTNLRTMFSFDRACSGKPMGSTEPEDGL